MLFATNATGGWEVTFNKKRGATETGHGSIKSQHNKHSIDPSSAFEFASGQWIPRE